MPAHEVSCCAAGNCGQSAKAPRSPTLGLGSLYLIRPPHPTLWVQRDMSLSDGVTQNSPVLAAILLEYDSDDFDLSSRAIRSWGRSSCPSGRANSGGATVIGVRQADAKLTESEGLIPKHIRESKRPTNRAAARPTKIPRPTTFIPSKTISRSTTQCGRPAPFARRSPGGGRPNTPSLRRAPRSPGSAQVSRTELGVRPGFRGQIVPGQIVGV
jgi:hypothetical protein